MEKTETKEVEIIAFHAINEFMRDDYRLGVLTEVFQSLERFPQERVQIINRLFARFVTLPGFRNSAGAPFPLKIKHSPKVFEKSPEYVAVVIESWSSLYPDLKKCLFSVLSEMGWDLPKINVDRSTLPGFRIDWPKEVTFESIIKTVREKDVKRIESDDHICLMAVWIGNRLPYNLFADSPKEEQSSQPD